MLTERDVQLFVTFANFCLRRRRSRQWRSGMILLLTTIQLPYLQILRHCRLILQMMPLTKQSSISAPDQQWLWNGFSEVSRPAQEKCSSRRGRTLYGWIPWLASSITTVQQFCTFSWPLWFRIQELQGNWIERENLTCKDELIQT